MDLDELRTVQSKERRKDSLQHLRDSFYADVATYIADLRAQRDRRAEQADDPFSDDGIRRLSDEIETAEEVAEAIYERRVGKVVKLASFAAADMPVETEGMTEDERRLFEDLVGRIERNKRTVLDALSGVTAPDELGGSPPAPEATADPEKATATTPADEEAPPATERVVGDDTTATNETTASEADEGSDLLAEAMNTAGKAQPEDENASRSGTTESNPNAEPAPSALRTDGASASGAPEAVGRTTATEEGGEPQETTDSLGENDLGQTEPKPDRTTVRITADVGEILGVDDREYELQREDVVTLPSTNAGPLLEQGAAERLE